MDADWRTSDRQALADPSDQDALLRAITARRRSGLPVPGWMLEQRLHAPRSFASDHPLVVKVHLPEGRQRVVGRTPGVVELPAHRALVVQPDGPIALLLPELANDVEQSESLTGLALAPDTTDADLAHLAAFPALERLDLAGCTAITDAGLAHVAALQGLLALDLWGLARIGSLRPLAGLHGLGTLNLRHAGRVKPISPPRRRWRRAAQEDAPAPPPPPPPPDLAPLSGLPSLSSLDLGECTWVDDEALAHLGRLPHLAVLDLSGCPIGDAGVAHLAGLGELTLLNLSRTKVTGASIATLEKLPNLAQLFLLGCGAVGPQAVATLQRSLPRCQVVSVELS